MNLTAENSLNNLNLQILTSALNTIKAEYGLGAEYGIVSILNIGCDAINRTTPMIKFNRQWNSDTFHYMGPIAMIKILTAILMDALDSIKRKITISMQNMRAVEFMIMHIRVAMGSLKYVASQIPTQQLYLIDDLTNLRAIIMFLKVE
jgi:hypothetical protein